MIAADRSRRRAIAWIAAATAGIVLALFLAFKVRSSIAAGRTAREARLAIAAGFHRQAKRRSSVGFEWNPRRLSRMPFSPRSRSRKAIWGKSRIT